MGIISDIFDHGFNIYKFLSNKSRSGIIHKRMILREIRDNIKRLEMRHRKGINLKILISKLQNENIVKAIEDNFNFNKLAKAVKIEKSDKLPGKMTKYVDWDCKKLVYSIDEKITALKDILDMFPELHSSGLNITARLNNLYIQCILVTYLIKKAGR